MNAHDIIARFDRIKVHKAKVNFQSWMAESGLYSLLTDFTRKKKAAVVLTIAATQDPHVPRGSILSDPVVGSS